VLLLGGIVLVVLVVANIVIPIGAWSGWF